MKRFALLLTLLAVVGAGTAASASVTTFTGNLDPGANIICLPGIPIDPAPSSVFGSANDLSGLFRYDAANQSQVQYDSFSSGIFGNMLLGEGYIVYGNGTNGAQFSYTGLNDVDSMDVWISLPRAGWTLIGNPFSYNYPWTNAKVTDGNVTVSLRDADKTYGWLMSTGFWYDSGSQSQIDIGLPEDFPTTDTLAPGHGYWILSNVDKLALILEAVPQS